MRRFWTRLNHKIRHKVFLRVLPVVTLSVLLVGGVGGVVFTGSVTGNRARSGLHEAGALRDHMALTLIKETLASEARPQGPGPFRVQHRHLTGPEPGSLAWAASAPDGTVTGAPTADQVQAWVTQNARFLATGYRSGSWQGTRAAGAPWATEQQSTHPIHVFPPLIGGPAGGQQALVPVVVRGDGPADEEHALYFFPLESLLGSVDPAKWLCLLDGQGRVLYAQGGAPAVGAVLADQPRVPGHPVLDKMPGQALWAAYLKAQGEGRSRLGSGPVPWLLLRSGSPELGLQVLVVDPVDDLRAAVTGYLWVILLAAVLAFTLAVVGINQVLKETTDQLATLARNMEALARGEYGGRMIQARKDEVGVLVGYFNLMAVSLDEAHRQVKEKAAHLRAALENMRMLDKAKDDFMVLISHEVRTPLTAIMGGVDYLKKSAENISPAEREVLDRLNVMDVVEIIHHSGERLSGFMTDAIQMTSMGSNEVRLDLRAVRAEELVEQGLRGVERQVAEKKVTVRNQLQGAQGWTLLCDPEVLGVAFDKILRNAVVHNRSGGLVIIREALVVPGHGTIADLITAESLRRLEGQAAFRDYEDGEITWRMIEVFNTGQPIPSGRQSALFGKFELVGRIENHQKGSGLSLPIAKAAVESHGGRILLHTDGRDGNSFFLMLPVVSGLPAEIKAPADELGHQQGQGVGGAAWDEDLGQVGDPASFEVELDDLCASILGGLDQTGRGVDGAGGADHQEKITVGRRGK